MGLLLTESFELILGQAAFQEAARVHAGGGMSLIEHLVAAARVIGAAEEVIVAYFIQGGG